MSKIDSNGHGKKKQPGKKGFSRRSFLQGMGISGGAVATLPTGLLVEPAAAAPVMGPGAVPVSLRINGKVHNLNLEPRVTLLDALRNHLEDRKSVV